MNIVGNVTYNVSAGKKSDLENTINSFVNNLDKEIGAVKSRKENFNDYFENIKEYDDILKKLDSIMEEFNNAFEKNKKISTLNLKVLKNANNLCAEMFIFSKNGTEINKEDLSTLDVINIYHFFEQKINQSNSVEELNWYYSCIDKVCNLKKDLFLYYTNFPIYLKKYNDLFSKEIEAKEGKELLKSIKEYTEKGIASIFSEENIEKLNDKLCNSNQIFCGYHFTNENKQEGLVIVTSLLNMDSDVLEEIGRIESHKAFDNKYVINAFNDKNEHICSLVADKSAEDNTYKILYDFFNDSSDEYLEDNSYDAAKFEKVQTYLNERLASIKNEKDESTKQTKLLHFVEECSAIVKDKYYSPIRFLNDAQNRWIIEDFYQQLIQELSNCQMPLSKLGVKKMPNSFRTFNRLTSNQQKSVFAQFLEGNVEVDVNLQSARYFDKTGLEER